MDLVDVLSLVRRPRGEWTLSKEKGIYALFLMDNALFSAKPDIHGLIYIGKTENQDGFSGRCYFSGRTLNHSPRKSLAGLLTKELSLEPIEVVSGIRRKKKWGLSPASDQRLSDWMYQNLLLALHPCSFAKDVKDEMIRLHKPPLNLDRGDLTPLQREVKKLRGNMQEVAF